MKKWILGFTFVQQAIDKAKRESKKEGERSSHPSLKEKDDANFNLQKKIIDLENQIIIIAPLKEKVENDRINILKLQKRNQDLIAEKNELCKQITQNKNTELPKDDKDRQINNLKFEIDELKKELEIQKQIAHRNKVLHLQ